MPKCHDLQPNWPEIAEGNRSALNVFSRKRVDFGIVDAKPFFEINEDFHTSEFIFLYGDNLAKKVTVIRGLFCYFHILTVLSCLLFVTK